MTTTIGIVAEGTHDFIMLSPLIKRELSKRGLGDFTLRPLQPAPDATGVMADGGWTRVLGWCQRYAGAKISTFFTPLFAGQESCNAIVLHIDGDALEHISPPLGITIPPGSLPVADRVALIVGALNSVLLPPQEAKVRMAFAVPVQHTEAWLLAAGSFAGDPSVIDAKYEFRRGYDYKKIKLRNYYEKTVSAITAGAWSEPSCVSYQEFAKDVAAAKLFDA